MPAPIPFPRPSGAPSALSACAAVAAPSATEGAPSDAATSTARRLSLRDLTVRPTPMFFVLLMPVPPLLVAAIGFGSIASGALAAVLMAVALGCLWRCVETLRGLGLRFSTPSPCFVGDVAMLELRVDNPGALDRWDIGIGIDRPVYPGPSNWVDVPPRSYNLALLQLPTHVRGVLPLPAVRIETCHPLGVAHTWARWQPDDALLVYPRPEMDAPSPEAARGRDGTLRLDPARMGLSMEAALSRLAAWVLRAERMESDYGLRLGSLIVPPGRGLLHRRRCLELLACWDGAPSRAWSALRRSASDKPAGSVATLR